MPIMKRQKTRYPGVTFIEAKHPSSGKLERVYYIRYRRDGKLVEEKAGRQSLDNMTPAKAAQIRARRMAGDELSNQSKRMEADAARAAHENCWTINRLWNSYLEGKIIHKGRRRDVNRFNKYITPAFGEKEPHEILPLDVDRFRLRTLKKLSPQSIKNTLELLRRVCNHGVKKGLCPGLGFKIEMPTPNNIKTEDLTSSQLKALLLAIESHPNINIANAMKLALVTGMRRGELARLTWRDVNFRDGFILLRDPKNGRDQHIPMNSAARYILEQHPQNPEQQFVFGGHHEDTLSRAARQIRDNAGLPKDFRPFHGLRHSFASGLASSGQVSLHTLQRLLTHRSPGMTLRYSHLRDSALRNASEVATILFSTDSEQRDNDGTILLASGK